MSNNNNLATQIEDLILSADDPRDKALLLILNKIATNLDENTQLTRALSAELKTHRDEFQAHEKTEMILINQGRGWYKASLFFLGILQALAFWMGTAFLEDHAALEKKVESISQYIEVHKEHHRQEEANKK